MINEIRDTHLVADPSWEERHELWGFVSLNVPVLDGFTTQEVVQLDGQHGTRHLLVSSGLLPCHEANVKLPLCSFLSAWCRPSMKWTNSTLCFLYIQTCAVQRIMGRIQEDGTC